MFGGLGFGLGFVLGLGLELIILGTLSLYYYLCYPGNFGHTEEDKVFSLSLKCCLFIIRA